MKFVTTEGRSGIAIKYSLSCAGYEQSEQVISFYQAYNDMLENYFILTGSYEHPFKHHSLTKDIETFISKKELEYFSYEFFYDTKCTITINESTQEMESSIV